MLSVIIIKGLSIAIIIIIIYNYWILPFIRIEMMGSLVDLNKRVNVL